MYLIPNDDRVYNLLIYSVIIIVDSYIFLNLYGINVTNKNIFLNLCKCHKPVLAFRVIPSCNGLICTYSYFSFTNYSRSIVFIVFFKVFILLLRYLLRLFYHTISICIVLYQFKLICKMYTLSILFSDQ